MTILFLFFFFLLSARDGVDGDGLLASSSMRLRLVFLPVRRVLASDVRGRCRGRLKPFLSLLHVKVQESPPSLMPFFFGPCTFNFLYGPYFCYISFNLVRLGPSIEINWMRIFTSILLLLISGLGLNCSINSVQQFQFIQFCPLIEIENKFEFHFGPYTFNFGFSTLYI